MKVLKNAIQCLLVTSTAYSKYDEGKCMSAIQGKEWTPIRINFEYMNEGPESTTINYIREMIAPGLKEYLESSLLIRDREEGYLLDRICAKYQFGVCVQVEANSSLGQCGDLKFDSDRLQSLDIYGCPPDATSRDDCTVLRRLDGGGNIHWG